MTWRLDQTDPYAYTLLDTLNNPIAKINFYDTDDGTDDNRKNNHAIATLAAAAPDLLATLEYYYENGDNDTMRARTTTLLKQLNAQPQHASWSTL